MIAKTIRDQCDELYAFRISFSDAKMIANDMANNIFLDCPEFKQGDFVYYRQYGDAVKSNIFSLTND